ncbi:MAG: 30S ribosomal protein S17 [Candidatus Omnitrophica bacterium]|nr:30S ribosomal protein S17 [Candidatus Omnitrophota bacterium]
MKTKYGRRKVLEGVVTSDKMEKTITVAVVKKFPHTLYKKQIIKRKRYKAHDEENKAKAGDKVKIIASKPLSKDKRFRLVEILNKG